MSIPVPHELARSAPAGLTPAGPESAGPEPALPPGTGPVPEPAFRLRGLTLGYGAEPVIRDLDLDIPSGKTTVLIGANGCGKSTILRALGRQLTPLAGSIEVGGRDLATIRPRAHAKSVAFLPQSPLVPEGLTVVELVARGIPTGGGGERATATSRPSPRRWH